MPALILYAIAVALGMGFEIAALKQLAIHFGMSLPATATVLAVFLLGLALGAHLIAQKYNNNWSLPKVFAGIQIGAGLWGLALPTLMAVADTVYMQISPASDTPIHLAIRAVLAAVLLFPLAMASGSLFPLFSTQGVRRVYATGMSAAVLGVLLTSLWLLPSFGMASTFQVLSVIALLTGVFAWFMPDSKLEIQKLHEPVVFAETAPVVMVAAIAGFALFLAEAVWLKLIWLVVDPTAYTEGIVLSSVLLAMALGAVLATRFSPKPVYVMGLIALGQLLLLPFMGLIAQSWNQYLPGTTFTSFLASEALLAFIVVGLPAIGYGLVIPLLCVGREPKSIAQIWFWHYIGAAIGMVAAASIILPYAGVSWALAIASIAMAVTIVLIRQQKYTVVLAATVAICSIVMPLLYDATYSDLAIGSNDHLVFQNQQGDGIVEVVQREDLSLALVSSRRRQEGGTSQDELAAARVQGWLPLALHPHHENVLVIGLGTGVSAAAMLEEESITTLSVVEISLGILAAAHHFSDYNRNLFTDSRVEIHHQDGRNFVKLTTTKYDLIVQELFFPYQTGSAALYAREHFERSREHLATDGRFVQWLALTQIGKEDLRILINTFQDVFAHTSLWLNGRQLMIMGGQQPLTLDLDNPAWRYYLAGQNSVRSWSEGAVFNTEDNLIIEQRLPHLFTRLNTLDLGMDNLAMLTSIQNKDDAIDASNRFAQAGRLQRSALLKVYRKDADALVVLEQAMGLDSGYPGLESLLLNQYAIHGRYEDLLDIEPENLNARYNFGVQLYEASEFQRAAIQFRKVVAEQLHADDALFNLANSVAQQGSYNEAAKLYARLLSKNPSHENARRNLGEIKRWLLLQISASTQGQRNQ